MPERRSGTKAFRHEEMRNCVMVDVVFIRHEWTTWLQQRHAEGLAKDGQTLGN